MQILGRSSVDIIKSGGYKISALDIEEVLLQHPRVLEVAVLGLPDQDLGQIITALVVLKQASAQGQQERRGQQQQQGGVELQEDGQGRPLAQQQEQSSTVAEAAGRGAKGELGDESGGLEDDLRAWCAGRLARYQVPRQWVLLQDRLPRNAMGKVNKKQLQTRFCAS